MSAPFAVKEEIKKQKIENFSKSVTDLFGSDLVLLLGPKANRVSWDSLDNKEQQRRIKLIPEYIDTSDLGDYPTFDELLLKCITVLAQQGTNNPLNGIDLPVFNSLEDACIAHGIPPLIQHNLVNVSKFSKNAKKQRDVFLRHILADIVFEFKPNLVFGGVGRQNSKGTIFVNDGQHRTLACMFLGIRNVPLDYCESDNEVTDIDQYAAININSLVASEFDKHRIRVQRAIALKNENKPLHPTDEIHYLFQTECCDPYGVTIAEKVNQDNTQGAYKVLTGIKNMINYTETYGIDIMKRSVAICAKTFPNTKQFHTANAWGLCEFIKSQDTDVDPKYMDYFIELGLKSLFQPNQGSKLHDTIKKQCRLENNNELLGSAEPKVVAEGIKQILSKTQPDLDFEWMSPKKSKGTPDSPAKNFEFTYKMI